MQDVVFIVLDYGRCIALDNHKKHHQREGTASDQDSEQELTAELTSLIHVLQIPFCRRARSRDIFVFSSFILRTIYP